MEECNWVGTQDIIATLLTQAVIAQGLYRLV